MPDPRLENGFLRCYTRAEMPILIALLLAAGEEKGTFAVGTGEAAWRIETVEDRLVLFFTVRGDDRKSDTVLTLSADDLRPLLYAAVHRRGREETEVRLEWKDGRLHSRTKAGVRETPASDEAFLDERIPGHFLLLARKRPTRVRVLTAAGELTTERLEVAGRRLRLGSLEAFVGGGNRVLEAAGWTHRRTPEMYGFRRPHGTARVPGVVLLPTDLPLEIPLVSAGFAVARIERHEESTLRDEIADARGAVEWMASRPDVSSVAILGHGDAGLAAAPASGRARAVVLVATPGRPYEDVLLARIERELRDVGEEQRREILEEQRRRLRSIASDFETVDGRRTFVGGLRERLAHDPVAALARTGCAVAILQGSEDVVVPPEDAERLAAARRDAVVFRFDGLDHSFRRGAGLDPAFLDALVGALK